MPLMIDDPVTVCNMALRHLGNSKGIMDFDNDATEPARGCRVFYPQVLDEVLRAFAWPFAVRFTSPSVVSGPTPAATPEWVYSYRAPIDCIWVRRILPAGTTLQPSPVGFPLYPTSPGSRIETQSSRIPYRIFADGNGKLILTDFPPVAATSTTPALPMIEYIAQIDDSTQYAVDFAQAIAWKLAFYLAPSLTAGDKFKLGDRAFQQYTQVIREAQASAKNEEQPDMAADAEWIQARA